MPVAKLDTIESESRGRQRAEGERQHGEGSDREASLGENVQLKRLREAAWKKEGGCPEDESAALDLLLGQLVNLMGDELRHSGLPIA